MNIMAFKRNVFESRKRPKGVLWPTIKPLLKDIISLEIVAGGGGAKPPPTGKHNDVISDVMNTVSLIDLASAEINSISVSSVVQFVKFAYNYENWDTFDALLHAVISELNNYPDDLNLQQENKILQLLKSLPVVNTAKIKKKLVMLKEPLTVPTPCCIKPLSKVTLSTQISYASNEQDKHIGIAH